MVSCRQSFWHFLRRPQRSQTSVSCVLTPWMTGVLLMRRSARHSSECERETCHHRRHHLYKGGRPLLSLPFKAISHRNMPLLAFGSSDGTVLMSKAMRTTLFMSL